MIKVEGDPTISWINLPNAAITFDVRPKFNGENTNEILSLALKLHDTLYYDRG